MCKHCGRICGHTAKCNRPRFIGGRPIHSNAMAFFNDDRFLCVNPSIEANGAMLAVRELLMGQRNGRKL